MANSSSLNPDALISSVNDDSSVSVRRKGALGQSGSRSAREVAHESLLILTQDEGVFNVR